MLPIKCKLWEKGKFSKEWEVFFFSWFHFLGMEAGEFCTSKTTITFGEKRQKSKNQSNVIIIPFIFSSSNTPLLGNPMEVWVERAKVISYKTLISFPIFCLTKKVTSENRMCEDQGTLSLRTDSSFHVVITVEMEWGTKWRKMVNCLLIRNKKWYIS